MPLTCLARRKIDDLLASAVARRDVPGVSALAADRDGEAYRGAFGTRTTTPVPDPMTTDTVVWIASMTKLIAAVAALQLVERGQLHLDEPLGRLLPELADPQVLERFDDEGQPKTRSARTPMTLRTLLSGTSGNGYGFLHPDLARYQQVKGLPGILKCREATLTTPLLFDPGTSWAYGMGLDWVGKVIEAATGGQLEDVLRANVLRPLGMDDTTFVLRPEHRARLAGLSMRGAAGSFVPVRFEVTQEPEFQSAGGGMYGTAEDYLSLLRMLLGRGEVDGVRLLSEETVAEAIRNQIGEHSIGRLATIDPVSSNDIDFLPGREKRWCLLGMTNVEPAAHGRSAGSLFWGGAGNTYFWVDWDNGDAGVLFAQLLPFADDKAVKLFEDFELVVHGY